MPFALLVFAASFIILLFSGKVLPRAIAGIARLLRISEFTAAFLLVSFATSIPELFVGVSSALQGVSSLSIGTVIGSNVVNLSAAVGIPVVIAGVVATEGKISKQNYWLIFLIALLPVLLVADGTLSRSDGLLLLIALSLYLYKIFNEREYFSKAFADGEGPMPPAESLRTFGNVVHLAAQFIFGTALLLGSSFLLVWSAKLIVSEFLGANFLLFGIVFVAAGTSLPELVFGIQAARGGYPQAMLGNALGSTAFNAAGIVGVTALIRPIFSNLGGDFWITAFFLFAAFVLFNFFVYTQDRLSRKEGIVLSLLYLVFLLVIFEAF